MGGGQGEGDANVLAISNFTFPVADEENSKVVKREE